MSERPAPGERPPSPPGADGIAVVGLAARFPGATDADAFWRNLRDGVESISRFAAEELAAAGVEPAELADPRYVPAKGVLAAADLFDAAFFGVTPREAEVMDPQHRVFLECAWEALEDAGCDPRRPPGRIGVWAGAGAEAYLIANLLPERERLRALGALQVLLLNDRDFLATRISYALDLKGPSATVQTACSTSLVAAHMACQSLLGGECDLALAGGVSISLPLRAGYLCQEGGVMSPDGHCRAFDAAAAGAVEGNGCGIVALKRLADAQAAGDRVYAVIRGSAVNNDGAARAGFTAPSVDGQAEVIAESLMIAGVAPETVGYVEAHGSGTPLGDPIEVAALAQAFRAAGAGAAHTGWCALGSVKTNIGHCNTAAGAAGLIKTVLALYHRTLPPSLHFSTPNPRIDFRRSPFFVPVSAAPWPAELTPRRAGVSSFGLGGTNAHLVLEEAPPAAAGEAPARPWQLLALSARGAAALDAVAARLAARLESDPELAAASGAGASPRLADIAWTLQTGRTAFEHRRVVVARDRAGAVAALTAPPGPGGGAVGRRAATGARPVVFMFPGLGDHYAGMARQLYEDEPVFRRLVDLCAERLTPSLGADLRPVMFGAPPAPPAAPAGEPALTSATAAAGAGPDLRALARRLGGGAAAMAEDELARTLFAQPACFVVEYALARLLMSWGIVPQALIGYSLGEYVAACLSGSLTLEEALDLVARRARRIEELPAGAMLAVPLAEEAVRPLLGAELSLAATNGPHFCVVAGPPAPVAALAARLAADGVACLRVRTTHAFHSRMMEPAAGALAGVVMRPPSIPWISNASGGWITADDLADPQYWPRHLCGTVRFAEGVGELLSEPERVFLEVGPGSTLGTLVQQHPAAAAERVTVAALRRAEEGVADVEQLLLAVGRLWIAGAEVDWARLHGGERRLRVALPAYPFERRRHWIAPPSGAAAHPEPAASGGAEGSPFAAGSAPAAAGGAEGPPLAAGSAPAPDLGDWFWAPTWTRAPRVPQRPDLASLPAARWLVLLDGEGLGERLAARLRALGHAVSTVRPGPAFAVLADDPTGYAVDPLRPQDYAALLAHLRQAAAGGAGGAGAGSGGGELPAKIVHLWGMTALEPAWDAAQARGLVSVTLLAQAVASAGGGTPIRLAVAANGLAEVVDGDALHPGKATVLGALEVLHQEVPRLTAGAIDAALPPRGSPAEELLIDQLVLEMSAEEEAAVPAGTPPAPGALQPPGGPPIVALRGRHRFVRGFEHVRLPVAGVAAGAPAGSLLRHGGVYLISGAEDGPGMALAEQLVRRFEARVALVVAEDFPPRVEWEAWRAPVLPTAPAAGAPAAPSTGEGAGAAIRRLLGLERDGGLDRVLVLRAAAGDAAAMGAALAETCARWGPPRGAFWTGGAYTSGLLQLKSPDSLRAALDPVARGAEALLAVMDGLAVRQAASGAPAPLGRDAAAGTPEPPPFVLLSSSTTAVTGGLGLLDLAAAGAFLEAVAARRAAAAGDAAAAGAALAVAAHWDPYQWGGWLAAGMAGGMTGMPPAEVEAGLQALAIGEERSADALERLLAWPLPAVVVSARDLHGLMAETDSVTADSMLALLAPGTGGGSARPALATPYEAPRDELEEQLAALWQDLFGIAPIGRDDSFLDLGGHSLLAIQIVTQARHRLGVDLPMTALFEATTVAQLAQLVRRARGEPDPAELEALLALVEGLSPEEAAERLTEIESPAAQRLTEVENPAAERLTGTESPAAERLTGMETR
ncbi:MAG TPA: beta-ketoacyl synthase N-terminal-like domain-containing protein [Thermoanaerobaculia bacterium]|nr:beta-ketoacyl synthase N-terminal-like domain-containing protein [Thermoanaerobaculia bacterium]